MTPPLSLPALLALIEEATPGPWDWGGYTDRGENPDA